MKRLYTLGFIIALTLLLSWYVPHVLRLIDYNAPSPTTDSLCTFLDHGITEGTVLLTDFGLRRVTRVVPRDSLTNDSIWLEGFGGQPLIWKRDTFRFLANRIKRVTLPESNTQPRKLI